MMRLGRVASDAITKDKEQTGLILRGICVKGIIAYFGYKLGTIIFSQEARYERMIHSARENQKDYGEAERFLDEHHDVLVRLGGGTDKEVEDGVEEEF